MALLCKMTKRTLAATSVRAVKSANAIGRLL